MKTKDSVSIMRADYTIDALIQAIKEKNESAFRVLYEQYAPALFSIIIKTLPDHHLAEDMLQQAFIKIWINIDTYDAQKGSFFTWMMRIVKNNAIDCLRSKAYNHSLNDVPIEKSQSCYYPDMNMRKNGVSKMLEGLHSDQRRLIRLSFFFGFTHQEIANHLQMPLGTVKTRIRLTLKLLRLSQTEYDN